MKPTLIAAEPVSAYDAKTHLPKLLERAERGERFVITRHGKPVAQLVPFESGDRESLTETLAAVAAIRSRLAEQGMTLAGILEKDETARGFAHDGHRY
jgi:prevent-host-death family protein